MSTPVQISPEWWRAVSAEGLPYYHNTTTKETTWDEPYAKAEEIARVNERFFPPGIEDLRDEVLGLIKQNLDLTQRLQQQHFEQIRQEALLQEQAIALREHREAAAVAAAELASLRLRMFNAETGRSSWDGNLTN